MSDQPAAALPPGRRSLAARLRLAGAALLWERAWPAAWPALCVVLVFLVLALFDVLPLLPGLVHAGVLTLFVAALAGAIYFGLGRAGIAAWPDAIASRRRIERSSGLAHRPLQALADRPSAPLDSGAAALWAAHQSRMAAAARRLRVGWPQAGLARHDPWGVRSVLAILLLLGAIDAGADWRDRLARAVLPGVDGGGPGTAAASFDLWLTPPEYTGLPPLFLRAGDPAAGAVPVQVATGSALLAQVHGGDAVPHLSIDGENSNFTAIDKQNFRFESKLDHGKLLTLAQGGTVLGKWPVEIVPDTPPTIAFAQAPKGTARAALRLDYKAGDDYGVESVKAVIRRQGASASAKDASDEKIELDLPLPGVHLREAAATSYHDLSPHPWAGLPVEIRLVATDALGQTGESEPARMVLPERSFHHPIARAIIDQRKELAKDPASAAAVAEILGDLNSRPALYSDDAVVFLALRLAQQQLRRDAGKAAITMVEQLLWDTALRIEDGHMSVAERDLRRLQQQLQDALAKGAPDADVEKLMAELREAMDRYLQAMAQEAQRHPNESTTPIDPSHMLTSKDLQRMLDRAQELARSGARDQAREMLSQLQNMLENLRTAQPGQAQQRGANQAQQMMRGMQDMMQRQQQLLDRSFRAQRQMGQEGRRGQQGQNGQPRMGQQPGQQPGEQPGGEESDSGQAGEMGDAAGQQEALRHTLGDMMRRLGDSMGDIPEPFGRAERAMRDAAGALQQGQPGQAIGPQTDALDQLQQAARDFAQQLKKRLGNGWDDQNGDEAGKDEHTPRNRQSDEDPFGRPASNNGTYDQGDVKIPDESVLQKSRQILDELRRRAGERARPEIELDYIDRLLKRF
ncbi:MAG TPA: TIGR02302 family protein [Stellaceae bacterium]|nr:TIGR02302 family protein [Stellaceae bacterium]